MAAGGGRFCLRRGGREAAAAPLRRPPLRLLCGRVVLPGMRRAPRVGLRRPAAVDRSHHLDRARDARRFPSRSPSAAGARRRGQGDPHGPAGPRIGRPPVRPGIGGAVRSAGAGLSGPGQLAFDESLRAALLDGLRLAGDPHHQDGKPEALAVVRRVGGNRFAEQVFHADLRFRNRGRAAGDSRTASSPHGVALGRRPAGIPDLPAQLDLEHPAFVPVSGVAAQHSCAAGGMSI